MHFNENWFKEQDTSLHRELLVPFNSTVTYDVYSKIDRMLQKFKLHALFWETKYETPCTIDYGMT
jgi:hypothetical protein